MENIIDEKDIRFYKRMIILIILLVISLSYLAYDRSVSYTRYERIDFQSSGATLYANLYFPSKRLEFLE
jgi:hypothetical protein